MQTHCCRSGTANPFSTTRQTRCGSIEIIQQIIPLIEPSSFDESVVLSIRHPQSEFHIIKSVCLLRRRCEQQLQQYKPASQPAKSSECSSLFRCHHPHSSSMRSPLRRLRQNNTNSGKLMNFRIFVGDRSRSNWDR